MIRSTETPLLRRLRPLAVALALSTAVAACDDDDDPMTPSGPATANFTLLIENVGTAFGIQKQGVFNTPVGESAPSAIGPGGAYEFSFTAPPGAKLSFATMFVPSNDFFFAPDEMGIALHDSTGSAISGNVTSQVQLWDAGTEVNQEPGTGADQVQRQSGPDTGADDADANVRLAPDDFSNLPAVSDVIEVTVTSTSDTDFTVRIENVSTSTTLTTTADMQAVPLSPGVWVVHSADGPLFTSGAPDLGDGLEAIAEDGDPSGLTTALEAQTGLVVPLSPGVWAVHTAADPLFTAGSADAGDGLEAIAEDGDPSGLAGVLAAQTGVASSAAFDTPVGATTPAAIGPGGSYSVTFTATEGDALSLASMFVPSNDLFFAPDGSGIALFSGSNPTIGDVTSQLDLWDAGTEVNQEPGVGLDQVQRQSGPNTGADEGGVVQTVQDAADGFTYPAIASVIRLTLSATLAN